MKQILFEVPIWKKQIKPSQIGLVSSDFKTSFLSDILTSYNGTNNISETGKLYLFGHIKDLLKEDIPIIDMLNLKIWRNIYNNNFQDKHNHAGCHFSFIVYEKIKKPQTVFIHPCVDLINASSRLGSIFNTTHKLNVQENDLVVFPSYLDHMVMLTENALTISGNFDIETE